MKRRTECILIILLVFCFILVILPVSADTGSSANTLTRGGRFSITITCTPNTAYYFWLARTYSMSGKPGDQPPVVQGNQYNVEQDPSDGPYTIGSYAYYNGNGRTILDDVAASSPEMPNTSYYGRVTTGADGRAIVLFRTSSATATRSFSVKAENPASAASGNVLVEETVYSRTTPATPQSMPPTTENPLTTQQTPVYAPATAFPTTTVPPVTPSLPPTRSDPMAGIVLIAIGTGLWAAARKN
nr:hypothetical protein [uncultured Methanoregula sp.]